MKEKSLSFDHRPDPVLGAALRQALSAEGHSPFVSRVLTALAAPRVLHWDVLAAWARPGIVAACAAALGAVLLVSDLQASVDLVASVAAPSAQELVATVTPLDPAFVLVSDELP